MSDLDRKMRDLDAIRTRDVWADAVDGAEHPSGRRIPDPPRGRRVLTIVVALSVAAASVLFLVDRLSTESVRRPADEGKPTGQTHAVVAPVDRLTVGCGPDGAGVSGPTVEIASDGVHIAVEGGGSGRLVVFRPMSGGRGDDWAITPDAAVLPLAPGPWRVACVDAGSDGTMSMNNPPDSAFTAAFEVVDPAGLWPRVQDANACGEPLIDPVTTAGVEAALAGPVTGRLLVNVSSATGAAGAALSVDADGSDPFTIASGPGKPSADSWSPDGTRVALAISDDDGNPAASDASTEDGEIYVADGDGSNLVRLTDNTASDDLVDWSPDGTTLSFRSNRDRGLYLYAMNADGTDVHRLVDLGGGLNESEDSSDWSPDGSRIAFVGDTGRSDDPRCIPDHELYIANADGTGVVQLTDDELYEQAPVWSPDGTQIAFAASQQSDYAWDIFVVNADGSNLRRLTAYPGYDMSPVWSPDGSMIAFTSDRGRGVSKQESQAGDLFVMNADGSGVRPMFPTGDVYRGAASAWIADWRA